MIKTIGSKIPILACFSITMADNDFYNIISTIMYTCYNHNSVIFWKIGCYQVLFAQYIKSTIY